MFNMSIKKLLFSEIFLQSEKFYLSLNSIVKGNQNILATVISETNIYHLSKSFVNNVLNILYGPNVIIITTLNTYVHLLNGKREI